MKAFIFIVFFGTSSLFAHNLEHTISHQKAVVIKYKFSQEGDFSYQDYEIYAPQSDIPFQVGRTNANSEIVFIPDTKGKYKIKTFSQDGHGKIIEMDIEDILSKKTSNESSLVSLLKPLFGIMILLAVFGFLYFIKRKKIEKN